MFILLLTVAASVWGSLPRTAPPGRWAEFWGCRWNTPVCRAATPSAGRPRRPGLWERRSVGSPECGWTERKRRVANYPSAQNAGKWLVGLFEVLIDCSQFDPSLEKVKASMLSSTPPHSIDNTVILTCRIWELLDYHCIVQWVCLFNFVYFVNTN